MDNENIADNESTTDIPVEEPNPNSILTTIKKLLGITEDYKHFDLDLTIHINSVFSILNQLGVGPTEGFSITGAEEEWSDFVPDAQIKLIEMLKSYVYLKVRLLFDPPMNSTVTESINKLTSELESRLIYAVDPGPDNT